MSSRERREFGPIAEINGVLGIKGVSILTQSGLPLYERQFTQFGMDIGLVGGFTSVLSMMFDNLQEEVQKGFETLQGKDHIITIHKAKYSLIMVVSDTVLPKMIQSQIRKSHRHIEKLFGELLDNEEVQNQLPFDEIDEIFKKYNFKIFLNDKLKLDGKKLDNLLESGIDSQMEDYISYIREYNENVDDNTFLIDDLIKYLEKKSISSKLIATVLIFAYNKNLFKFENS